MPIVAGVGVGVTDLTEDAKKNRNCQYRSHCPVPSQTAGMRAPRLRCETPAPLSSCSFVAPLAALLTYYLSAARCGAGGCRKNAPCRHPGRRGFPGRGAGSGRACVCGGTGTGYRPVDSKGSAGAPEREIEVTPNNDRAGVCALIVCTVETGFTILGRIV
jgi:hypothetical protein